MSIHTHSTGLAGSRYKVFSGIIWTRNEGKTNAGTADEIKRRKTDGRPYALVHRQSAALLFAGSVPPQPVAKGFAKKSYGFFADSALKRRENS
jgi:hypothetical protein